MKISEVMTRDVRVTRPDHTISEAARIMASIDAGSLPVAESERLIGVVTDRDIVIRAVSQAKGPDTPVRDVMSHEVKYCFEDEDVDEVTRNMGDIQVRRLPVVDRGKRLVGIVSLGDLARHGDDAETVGAALEGISRSGGQHNQVTQ